MRQHLLLQRRTIQNWSSFASIQVTNSLHSKKGKGRITPRPDISGLGVTGGPVSAVPLKELFNRREAQREKSGHDTLVNMFAEF